MCTRSLENENCNFADNNILLSDYSENIYEEI